MTLSVTVSKGINYCLGQRLMVGGQWLTITAKYPMMDESGKVTGYNILVEKK